MYVSLRRMLFCSIGLVVADSSCGGPIRWTLCFDSVCTNHKSNIIFLDRGRRSRSEVWLDCSCNNCFQHMYAQFRRDVSFCSIGVAAASFDSDRQRSFCKHVFAILYRKINFLDRGDRSWIDSWVDGPSANLSCDYADTSGCSVSIITHALESRCVCFDRGGLSWFHLWVNDVGSHSRSDGQWHQTIRA